MNIISEIVNSRLSAEQRQEALRLVKAADCDMRYANHVRARHPKSAAELEGAAHGQRFRAREMVYDTK